MNIKRIFFIALTLGFQTHGYCSTNVTLFATAGFEGPRTASFSVSTGQLAKVIYSHSSGLGALLSIRKINGSIENWIAFNPNESPMVVGPAVIQAEIEVGGNGTAFCTIEASTPAQTFLPSTAVVIPADAGGPVNIILESSSDLINWSPSLPGSYGANYTNRFFRVRAQLTQ